MDNAIEVLKQRLSRGGYQMTKAREATFRLLMHPTPQTMGDILAKAPGKVDRVSIYRNIELFEKLGLVNRIYSGWKYKIELSDEFTGHHHHLTCLKCGTVLDIEDEEHIDEFIHEISQRYGFTPRRHQFEIDGFCGTCTSTIDTITSV